MDWIRATHARYPSLDEWKWSWSSVTTIVGTPNGPDGTVIVEMDSGDHHRLVRFSSAVTIAITTAGVNGLHNDHAEAANIPYAVYLCAKAGTVGGFLVPDGTTINAAKMATLGDGSYDWWSVRPVWFIRNNAGSNIEEFTASGPRSFAYRTQQPITSFTAGFTSTSATAIPFTHTSTGLLIPATWTKRVLLQAYVENTGATTRSSYCWADSGATLFHRFFAASAGGANNDYEIENVWLAMEGLTPGASYWAQWSGAITGNGLDLDVVEVCF